MAVSRLSLARSEGLVWRTRTGRAVLMGGAECTVDDPSTSGGLGGGGGGWVAALPARR